MKKHKVLRVVLAVMVCMAMITPQLPVFACGPYFPQAFFVFTKHPDFPLDHFAAGDLGVLQPTYARSYLVVAYRYLNDVGLDRVEQAAVVSLWKARLDHGWGYFGDDGSISAEKKWFSTRAKVPGVRPMRSGQDMLPNKESGEWNHIESISGYDSHVNCLDPALESAANTLQSRIHQFGLASTAVKSWVDAQDAVFTLCNGLAPRVFPSPPDPTLPAIINADRAYQIAAAHFYARDYEVARQLFGQISRDESSSWRATGALMAARSLIRKTTIYSPNRESERFDLQEARSLLVEIVKDKSMAEAHHSAKDLISFIDARISPAEYVHSLAQTLAAPKNANLQHDLDDYTILLDKWLGSFDDPPWDNVHQIAARYTGSSETLLPSAIRSDPLTDWVLTFQSLDSGALSHAIQRWRQTGSVAWLVTAMTKLNAGAPEAAELLSAAKKVGPESPAYPTVIFSLLRIETLSGGRDSARRELDTLLETQSKKMPRSSLNLFLRVRMSLAQNVEELLRFAPRIPASIGTDKDQTELPNTTPFFHDEKGKEDAEQEPAHEFDVDGAWTLTRALPTSILVHAVESKSLPPKLRSAVADFTWVRTIVLDDETGATRLAPIVAELESKLAPEMKDYLAATDSASRKFRAIVTILRTPGLRPYISQGVGRDVELTSMERYGNNWWCSLNDAVDGKSSNSDLSLDISGPGDYFPDKPDVFLNLYGINKFPTPRFLSAEESRTAEKEWMNLSKSESGSTWLAHQAFDWAVAHPDDPLTPESLHLVVRVLRYSCGEDKIDSKLSHEAFNLLHRKYPNSEWTKKTPYWF